MDKLPWERGFENEGTDGFSVEAGSGTERGSRGWLGHVGEEEGEGPGRAACGA
jgi:hypothetical protein